MSSIKRGRVKQIIFLIFLALPTVPFANNDYDSIKIEGGVVLEVKKRDTSHSDPYSFYDQTISSIQTLYPKGKILANRRNGRLGHILYSIVCYKKNFEGKSVVVLGTLVVEKTVIEFSAKVPEEKFGDHLLIILENVERIASS